MSFDSGVFQLAPAGVVSALFPLTLWWLPMTTGSKVAMEKFTVQRLEAERTTVATFASAAPACALSADGVLWSAFNAG